MTLQEFIDATYTSEKEDDIDCPLDEEALLEQAVTEFRGEVLFLLNSQYPVETHHPKNSKVAKLIASIIAVLDRIYPVIYTEVTDIEVLSMNEIVITLHQGD